MKRLLPFLVITAGLIAVAVYYFALTGSVAISTVPSGLPVEIDGNEVGNSPLDERLFIGTHTISALSPEFGHEARELKVGPGSHRIVIELGPGHAEQALTPGQEARERFLLTLPLNEARWRVRFYHDYDREVDELYVSLRPSHTSGEFEKWFRDQGVDPRDFKIIYSEDRPETEE